MGISSAADRKAALLCPLPKRSPQLRARYDPNSHFVLTLTDIPPASYPFRVSFPSHLIEAHRGLRRPDARSLPMLNSLDLIWLEFRDVGSDGGAFPRQLSLPAFPSADGAVARPQLSLRPAALAPPYSPSGSGAKTVLRCFGSLRPRPGHHARTVWSQRPQPPRSFGTC